MGSHLLEVLRQGIWASVTGGWFHDPRQPIFTNTVHLYLWLFLLALPLTLCIYFTSSFVIWSSYCGAIGFLFLMLKTINCRFHYLFDSTEPTLEETTKPTGEQSQNNGTNEIVQAGDSRKSNDEDADASNTIIAAEPGDIELQVMSSSSRSKNRLLQPHSPADADEDEDGNEEVRTPIGGNLKVDVHHHQRHTRKDSSPGRVSTSSSTTSNCSTNNGSMPHISSRVVKVVTSITNTKASAGDLSQEKSNGALLVEDGKEPDADGSNENIVSVVSSVPGDESNADVHDTNDLPSLCSSVSQDEEPSILSMDVADFHNSANVASSSSSRGSRRRSPFNIYSLDSGLPNTGTVRGMDDTLGDESCDAKRRSHQNFRRTQSALETISSSESSRTQKSLEKSRQQRRDRTGQHISSSSHELRITMQDIHGGRENESHHSQADSRHSQAPSDNQNPVPSSQKRDGTRNDGSSDSEDTDSDSDQARSRTPLLARHSSLEQKSKKRGQYSSKVAGPGLVKEASFPGPSGSKNAKKVSFSARSLDGGSTSSGISVDQRRKGGKRSRGNQEIKDKASESTAEQSPKKVKHVSSSVTAESVGALEGFGLGPRPFESRKPYVVNSGFRRFYVIPQDESVITGRSHNRPAQTDRGHVQPQQWLLQAMNVAVKAIASTIGNTPAATSTSPNVEEGRGRVAHGPAQDALNENKVTLSDWEYDAESVASNDSYNSSRHSLYGLRWLFGGMSGSTSDVGEEGTDHCHLHSDSSGRRHRSDAPPPASFSLQSEDHRGAHSSAGSSQKSYLLSNSGNNASSRRSGRTDREPSPRILERLLEESHAEQPSPSSSFSFSAVSTGAQVQRVPNCCVQKDDDMLPHASTSSSTHHHRSSRRRSERDRDRQDRTDSSSMTPNAFDKLKLQLRSLGPQNTLDIAGQMNPSTSGAERYNSHGTRCNIQGIFRQRDETSAPVNCDIDNSTSTVNRHRRLRRLAHSRRSLERRREAPYGSPPPPGTLLPAGGTLGLAPGTHMANSHDDTSEGAVHYFQDERGAWHTYIFATNHVSSNTFQLPHEAVSGSSSRPSLISAMISHLNDHHGLNGPPVAFDSPSSSFSQGASGDQQPRQSSSLMLSGSAAASSGAVQGLNLSLGMNMSNTSASMNKTPSSSESWSSGSSTELAVDPNTNKLYAAFRRSSGDRHHRFSPHGHSHSHSNSHSHRQSRGSSPIPSVPSLVTITPEFSGAGSSGVHHGLTTRLPLPTYSSMQRTWQRNRRDVIQALTESLLERRRNQAGNYHLGQSDIGQGLIGSDGHGVSDMAQHSSSDLKSKRDKKQPAARVYYKMKLLPFYAEKLYAKIWFDRLKLMALFDRNRTFWENLLAVLLATGVACLGSFMLHQGYYHDLTMVLLCLVMASCQFSLLKSVQPDASSPTHGFNRIVAFSRPIYFCICGMTVFLIQMAIDSEDWVDLEFKIYRVDVTNKDLLEGLKDFILIIILSFPFLFSVGLFPQFNTFTMYLFEQIDMHVFGGNATTTLSASFTGIFRSVLAIGVLYGFAYGALGEPQSTQHLLFSIFCGLLMSTTYHLSRCSSDPSVMWTVLKQQFCPDEDCFGETTAATSQKKMKEMEEQGDPLPKKLRDTVYARLKNDTIICSVIGVVTFGLHSSTVFTALQPGLKQVLSILAIVIGFGLHYVIPQFRKQLPCLLISHPILPPGEYDQFEVRDAARLMWFERVYLYLCFFERNIVYPLLFISALTEESSILVKSDKFNLAVGSLIIVTAAVKNLRTSYSDPAKHYLILFFTLLFFEFDWEGYSETFLVDFFFMSIAFHKVYELWLKLQFIITYIAPWQITWGSAFHAFAQPFSVPHSAMLFLQAVVSSVISAPLNPFLGSAIFITSYVRPVKFWERDYNTKRVDHSNTRLSSHLEKNPGADDNNLNSIFYEHLTRSLQDSLCGDINLGRWGLVAQGDCFVLASDYLNCLVHIIEVGNGLITFQMRGLEFRGTYCQQREVEAISEGVDDDEGLCCCEPGHLPHMLSMNAAFSQRWLAWEVTVTKYVLEGYSISDNSAVSMLQVFDLRKILISYYVKSVIYYTVKAEKLEQWLESEIIATALKPTLDKHYADLDPVFNLNIDEDFDFNTSGITRNSFCSVYLNWIQYCLTKRNDERGTDIECTRDSMIVSLCFSLSILARRALGVAAHSNSLSSVEFFLYGLHALFKGDFRITSQRDEWVFTDMDLMRKVVSAAVRMSLKLHQDHFMCPDEYEDSSALYDAITYHDEHLVISHEGDPAWRSAVLAGTPALLALRHVLDDGADEYKIIMLNKRHLSFRVIKLNRECVRGLWAGQQQELVYLRNRDPERGSIQNAKQALRNIINSSCDQPIGYPIYVSPLTTSYADSHIQLCSVVGGPISLSKLKESAIALWRRIRRRCGEGCSSGSSSIPMNQHNHHDTTDTMTVYYGQEGVYNPIIAAANSGALNLSGSQSLDGGSQIGGSGSMISGRAGSLTRGNFNRGSVASSNVSNAGSFGKPSTSTLASLAGFLTDTNGNTQKEREKTSLNDKDGNRPEQATREYSRESKESSREREKTPSLKRVCIIDANQVYDGLNLGRRIDVVWPDESMRARGGRSYWQNWVPEDGMDGVVVHKWIPGHRDPKCRSITDKTILLLKIDDKFVPISETGVAVCVEVGSSSSSVPVNTNPDAS